MFDHPPRAIIRLFLLPLVPAVLTLSGCASITMTRRQAIHIDSMTEDAVFSVFDAHTGIRVHRGTLPATFLLKRKRSFMRGARYRVVVEKAGHEPRIIDLIPRVNPMYLSGNLVFGGIIGWALMDPATGGMWSLRPARIDVELEPVGTAPAPGDAP